MPGVGEGISTNADEVHLSQKQEPYKPYQEASPLLMLVKVVLMERAPKRQRLDFEPITNQNAVPSDGVADAAYAPHHWQEAFAIREKLKGRFEDIFDKYGRDFTGVGDEIDLMTGEVVVDNGHLAQMTDERDARAEALESNEEGYEGSDDEKDELASIGGPRRKMSSERATARPAGGRSSVFLHQPHDPKWAAPEIPGLSHGLISDVKLGLSDQPLDDASERSASPERSLWHIDTGSRGNAGPRLRLAWTAEEIRLLCRLKNSGRQLTLKQLQKYLPHRGVPSIRLRWLQIPVGTNPGFCVRKPNCTSIEKSLTSPIRKGGPNASIARSSPRYNIHSDEGQYMRREPRMDVDDQDMDLCGEDKGIAIPRGVIDVADSGQFDSDTDPSQAKAFDKPRDDLATFTGDQESASLGLESPTLPKDTPNAVQNVFRTPTPNVPHPDDRESSKLQSNVGSDQISHLTDSTNHSGRPSIEVSSSVIEDLCQTSDVASFTASDDSTSLDSDRWSREEEENDELLEHVRLERHGYSPSQSTRATRTPPVSQTAAQLDDQSPISEKHSLQRGYDSGNLGPLREPPDKSPLRGLKANSEGLSVVSGKPPTVEKTANTLSQRGPPKRNRSSPTETPKLPKAHKMLSTPRSLKHKVLKSSSNSTPSSLSLLNNDSDDELSVTRALVPNSAKTPRRLEPKPGLALPASEKRPVCGRNGFSCGRSLCLRCVQ